MLAEFSTDGMAGQRSGHVAAAPIIAAAAPLLGAGAPGLRRAAAVEEEPRAALEGAQVAAPREAPAHTYEVAAPRAAAFRVGRIEKQHVFARRQLWVVAVGRVEVAHMIGRIVEGH